ncbi:MAG: hypothetical protein Q7T56_06345 [Nocardioidaceae bacterium]|nr:hypothetical protein [Nocardioidaceae bacterium]
MTTSTPYLHRESSTLLALLAKAARASPDATSTRQRQRLVDGWLDRQDHFAPASLLETHGDARLADRLTPLCTHGDVSPSIWRLARQQFDAA